MNLRYFSYGLFLLLSCTFISCTPSSSPSAQDQGLQPGSRPFQLDPKKAVELTVAQFDPNTGNQWNVILKNESDEWKFSHFPSDVSFLDAYADGTFIAHLIDTFKSLRVESPAPNGPLESLGLKPPRFAIRLRTQTGLVEFQAGSKVRGQNGYYFTVDGQHAFVATGSTFQMLDMIESAEFLRKRTWTLVSADDIDEIRIRKKNLASLYAQREGNVWTNEKHQPIKKNIETFLSKVTSAQAQKFIDDPVKTKNIQKLITSQPFYEVDLIDRSEKRTSFKFMKAQNTLYGLNSSRPSAVFVLDNQLIREFEKLN
jgi:hypothetical protein